MTIGELRSAVDAVDAEIVAALHRRFELTDEIGRVKRETGATTVFDGGREAAVLAKVGPELAEIYRTILSVSKARQSAIVG